MAKRLTICILALALCLTLVPAQSFAIQGPKQAVIKETNHTGDFVFNYGGYGVIEQKGGIYLLIDAAGGCYREADKWMEVDGGSGIYQLGTEGYYTLPDSKLLFTREQMEANAKAFLEENYPVGEIVSVEAIVMTRFSEGYASNSFRAVYKEDGEQKIYEFYALIDKSGLVHYATPLISYTSGGGFPIMWTLDTCHEGLVQFTEQFYNREGRVETYEIGYKDVDGNDVMVFSASGSRDPEDQTVILHDMSQVTYAGSFHNGVAEAYNADGQVSLIDRYGRLQFPFRDGSIYNDTGSYPISFNGRNWGYIDTAGVTVLPEEYDFAAGSYGLLFTVQKGDLCGVVDENGKEIVPFEYEAMSHPVEGVVYAIKDGKVYVITFEDAKEDGTQPTQGTGRVSAVFKDVPAGAWYESFLQNAYDNSIIGGKYDENKNLVYDPQGSLTHAQIMVMVTNLHALQKSEKFQPAPNPTAHWADAYKEYCKAEDIIDGRFDASLDLPVTREEMAYYFANALPDDYYKDKVEAAFADMADTAYADEIYKLAKADIVGGYKVEGQDVKEFRPGNPVTRAEAAVFISNILAAIGSLGPVGVR